MANGSALAAVISKALSDCSAAIVLAFERVEQRCNVQQSRTDDLEARIGALETGGWRPEQVRKA